jgi:hypothetical protein
MVIPSFVRLIKFGGIFMSEFLNWQPTIITIWSYIKLKYYFQKFSTVLQKKLK